MPLLIPALVLLLASFFMTAYAASRKEARLPHLTVKIVVLMSITFVLFLAGTIVLFIATGWKWGLVGLGISWLVTVVVAARTGAPKYVDPLSVKRIEEIGFVEGEHHAELEEFWKSNSPDERASLAPVFLDELRGKWPREYSQVGRLLDATSKECKDGIVLAYKVGYMCGRGWISQKHLIDFNLYLGDKLANSIKLGLKGAKSRGDAFVDGYTCVAVRGHLKALKKGTSRHNANADGQNKP